MKIEQGQREFLALHARLLPPAGARDIAELTAAGVPAATILSLYPFEPAELAGHLQAHLRTSLRYSAFVRALNLNLGNSRYISLRNLSCFAHKLERYANWDTFYRCWQQGATDRGWEILTGDHLTVNDGFDALWIGAHWGELEEMHRAADEYRWMLGRLGATLDFVDAVERPIPHLI